MNSGCLFVDQTKPNPSMSIPQAIDFCKTTSETQQCFVAYESVKPRGVVIASTFPKFI